MACIDLHSEYFIYLLIYYLLTTLSTALAWPAKAWKLNHSYTRRFHCKILQWDRTGDMAVNKIFMLQVDRSYFYKVSFLT